MRWTARDASPTGAAYPDTGGAGRAPGGEKQRRRRDGAASGDPPLQGFGYGVPTGSADREPPASASRPASTARLIRARVSSRCART